MNLDSKTKKKKFPLIDISRQLGGDYWELNSKRSCLGFAQCEHTSNECAEISVGRHFTPISRSLFGVIREGGEDFENNRWHDWPSPYSFVCKLTNAGNIVVTELTDVITEDGASCSTVNEFRSLVTLVVNLAMRQKSRVQRWISVNW